MNLLEPWIFLRLAVGVVTAALFARGAWVSARVLRHFDVARATEGQLALERQAELASTFVRVGSVLAAGSLLFTVLAADRLSHSVRGAMCAYGVFGASRYGFAALAASVFLALAAGTLTQLFALDTRVRDLSLVRPLAMLSIAVAPLALLDLALNAQFFLGLDLTVVASCCSVGLDGAAASASTFVQGPRQLVTTVGPLIVAASAITAWLVSTRGGGRHGTRAVVLSGLLAVAALPFALGAAVLEVAPHAFELPGHLCPFCLLRSDVYGIGYPLFGSIFLAVIWGAGAAIGALLLRLRPESSSPALAAFVRPRLRGQAIAWLVALAVGAFPVLRYAIVTGGASLFP
jgi:hypothetical protein